MYDILYCNECNAVLVTDEEIDCLVCNKPMKEIGFTDKPIQQILEHEASIKEKESQ